MVINLATLKATLEEGFRCCFFGGVPPMRIVGNAVTLQAGKDRIYTVREGTTQVKRYRQPQRFRGVYYKSVPALVVECTNYCQGPDSPTQVQLASPEFDVGRVLGYLLEHWAIYRVRDFCRRGIASMRQNA